MTTRLIASPDDIGISPSEVAARPSILIDLREDLMNDLMTTQYPIQRRVHATGHGTPEADGRPHRRTCV